MNPLLETTIAIPFHTLLILGFYIALGVYLIFTTILYFHWHEYSTDARVSRITALTYLSTTLPFITILGIATLFI